MIFEDVKMSAIKHRRYASGREDGARVCIGIQKSARVLMAVHRDALNSQKALDCNA
jgi:hypothetical protein